jgi:hypothetical protein
MTGETWTAMRNRVARDARLDAAAGEWDKLTGRTEDELVQQALVVTRSARGADAEAAVLERLRRIGENAAVGEELRAVRTIGSQTVGGKSPANSEMNTAIRGMGGRLSQDDLNAMSEEDTDR